MKKGLIVLLILLGALSVTRAQDSLSLKPMRHFISGTSIIKKALSGAFYLIQQDYILVDKKGSSFGRGGKKYFGRHYGIGITAQNVLWAEKRVLYPWIADKSYKVMAGDSLLPKKGVTKFARYQYKHNHCNCDYKENGYKSDSIPLRSLAYYKLPKNKPTMKLHQREVPSWGIMVIFYTPNNEPMSTDSKIKMSVTKQFIKWDDARSRGELKGRVPSKNVIGGAFFSTSYEMGSVAYRLVGLYTRKTKSPKKWELTAFQNEFTKKLTLITPPKEEGKGKKKRKKRGRRRNRNN